MLANDKDNDGTLVPSTVKVVGSASNGEAKAQADGTIIYTPSAGTTATSDSFTYTVEDNDGGLSNVATVTVEITGAVIVPPVAIVNDDQITIAAGVTGTVVDVTANDDASTIVDGAVITLVGAAPVHGDVNVVGDAVVYDHDGSDGFEFPVDQFAYTVTNPGGVPSAVATVTVNITEVNNPPLATSDAISVSLSLIHI